MTVGMETLSVIQPYTLWDLTHHSIMYPSDILYLNGDYIIIDQYNHRILWIDNKGALIRSSCKCGGTKNLFQYPTSLCTDYHDSIWVTDRWNHCVRHLSGKGELLGSFGVYGTQPGTFSEPWGIGFNSGKLYVSDRNNHRIQVFDTQGNFITAFGNSGPDKEYFESNDFKRGFIFEHWKNISHKFLTYDTLFYDNEYTIGTFEYPQNLSLSPSGNIAVADTGNDRIQIFSSSGSLIESITTHTIPDKGDFFSDILFIDDDTLLITAELNNIAYRKSGNCVETYYTLPEGRLNCISKGANGDVIALDTWNAKLAFFK